MKRIAFMLSLFMLAFGLTLFAANTEKAAVDQMSREHVLKVNPEHLKDVQKNGPQILGESVIFMEDFESDPLGWFFDGGYGVEGGEPEVAIIPPAWAASEVKANSPVTSLFHDDNVASSRDFAFSPPFTIPAEIDGDPVVSAKLSFQINIDNPGYASPTTPYLADYYMVYAGLEETTWGVVDVAGDMVYYSGYPESNSFQFLTSPVIDLTAATAPVALDFKYLMINELHWDLGRVDVLVEGEEDYTTVGMLNDDSGTWMDMTLDLSAFAGKMVQVRFAFLPDDATAIEDGGLWLNDIKVSDAVGDIFMDDAEAGNAVMEAFGVTLARLFYDYDRVGDGGAAFHPWGEAQLYNGTADLFDLGIQPGDKVWLAFRYVIDGDNTQGEEDSDGAFFDDIKVTAISGVPADAGVSKLVVGYPQTAGLSTPIAATVTNFGFEEQTIALWYNFDGVNEKPVPPFLTLDPFADSLRIFETTMPMADSTELTVKTKLTGDMVPENDALSTMLYPDAPGTATLSYFNGAIASYTTSNRIVMFDALAAIEGIEKYSINSVDIWLYNPGGSGISDVVNVKVALWDEDPLNPTEVVAESDVTVPNVGFFPVNIPVGKMDVTSKFAVWFNFDLSAKVAGPLLDTGTPFTGNEVFLNAADGNWYYSGRGTMLFANLTYPTYARLQVIHNAADPAAALVDVYVNDGLLLDDFAFRAATPFIDVPANVELTVGVAPSTSTSVADVIAAFPVTFETDGTYIVFANGVLDPAQFAPNPEGLDIAFTLMAKAGAREAAMAADMIDFFVFHGVTDAPVVDVVARDVGVVVDNAGYGAMTDYLSVPAAKYILDITPGDDNATVVASFVADVSGLAGGAAAVFASGFLTPEANQMGEAFGLFVALPNGVVVQLPSLAAFDITIDAEKDAWYEQLTGPTDGHLIIPAATPNNNGEPADDADLSAKLWTAWDETYLYLYEEVKDNVVNVNNATSWQNDVLEVYIDPNPSAAITTAQLGFHITALDSADADPAALAGVINLRGYNLTTGATTDDYARKRTADGYVLECRVKWGVLKDATRSITPAAGTIFGMATMNHDNDVAQREGSVSFATVLNDNVWNTPANHGTVTFLDDHKLQFEAKSIRSGAVNPLAPLYTPSGLPEPWLTMDIGAVAAAGKAEIVDGKVVVTGSGADIWGRKDEFRFVFQTLSGDVEITANLEELTQSDPWTKGTLMIRDALNDSSAHAIMAIASQNGEAFQWRPTPGAESIHQPGDTSVKPPKWLKLIRMGNIFKGYTSSDGEKWNVIHSQEIVMKDPVFVGMAVTSHNDGALSVGTYSGVEVSREPMEPELDFNIVIDAVKDPWYRSLSGPENGHLSITAAHYNNNGQPDNAADLSALMWMGWDENYLYFYEEVKDEKVNLNHPTSWQNDILEMYFDPEPAAKKTTGQIGITMTALDSADTDPANYTGVMNLTGNGQAGGNVVSKNDYARAKVTGGYVLEGRVKWEWIKATDGRKLITPAVGTIFGMASMNHDNDNTQREGSITWATVMNDDVWNVPTHHATVQFLDGHQLMLKAENAIEGTVNPLASLYQPTKLPSPWLTMDVGAVGLEGSVTESGGVWRVTGSGADIWGTADAFHFAFQVLKGDVELTAQLTGLTKSDPWTKGALMIRDELTADSKHAIMALASDNGQAFQYRPTKGAESVHIAGLTTAKAPQWLKVIRAGDIFSGWVSADGKAWHKVGQVEFTMADQIYVGMAVTAHLNTALSTGTYSNVTIKTRNITEVEEEIVAELPTEFVLSQNYPNPFNPTTTIEFALPIDSQVQLTIFDILGREVVTLIDGKMEAGNHHVSFDAADHATGVYFYRLKAGDRVFQKKMMLIK